MSVIDICNCDSDSDCQRLSAGCPSCGSQFDARRIAMNEPFTQYTDSPFGVLTQEWKWAYGKKSEELEWSALILKWNGKEFVCWRWLPDWRLVHGIGSVGPRAIPLSSSSASISAASSWSTSSPEHMIRRQSSRVESIHIERKVK